jgi:rhodanese-related sulfurtransferase
MPLNASDLVARARQSIREASPADIQQRLAGAAVIDVREPQEYATGHLPGAVNIPRGMLEFEISTNPHVGGVTDPALADRSRHIVLYCLTGGRAALAAAALQELGYSNVESIQGGVRACVEAGLALTTHGS